MKKILLSFFLVLTALTSKAQNLLVSFKSTVGQEREISLASSDANVTFYVDFGDGNRVEKATTEAYDAAYESGSVKIAGTVKGNGEVKVYGEKLVAFESMSNVNFDNQISSINVDNAPDLVALTLNGNKLTEINLTNNTKLVNLVLSNNQLTSLNLSTNKALKKLELQNNHLTSLNLENNVDLTKLTLSDNPIETLDLSHNTNLKMAYLLNMGLQSVDFGNNTVLNTITLNNNKLKTFDATKLTGLAKKGRLFLISNQLTEIKVGAVQTLNISKNNFTLATLPVLKNVRNYTYAPQNPMTVAVNNQKEKVDLSSLDNLTGFSNGVQKTNFVWKNANNDVLQEGTDYTVENGVFSFLKVVNGAYCEMTTEAFPKFVGTSKFKTAPLDITVTTGISSLETNADEKIEVYNVNGVFVGEKSSLSTLPKGMYIVKSGKKVEKLQVK